MKINLHPKYLLTAITALSIFSFIYVNFHAATALPALPQQTATVEQPALKESEEDEKNRNLAVPDITILSRVIDIVQRYTQTEH